MRAIVAISAGALALGWQTPAQQFQKFRGSVETVAVYATVHDSRGRVVTGLDAGDFELFDNGKRRDITVFSNELQPTTLSMLIDRSGSTSQQVPQITSAARAFVGKLLPGDRASLSTLTWDCQPFTADTSALDDALNRGLPTDAGSPIWRGMDRVLSSLDAEGSRRALLIFSDGQDTGMSKPSPWQSVPMSESACHGVDTLADVGADQVSAHARQEGALIYAVSVPSAMPGPMPATVHHVEDDSTLRRIAKDSGGETFLLKSADELSGAFTTIADELHHQYLLGFVPADFDGRVHTIELRMRRSGLTVRGRKNYVASHTVATGPEADANAFASRAPWPALTDDEVRAAIRDSAAGHAPTASCTAARIFDAEIETRTSIHVVAEGPVGRIMRAVSEARLRQSDFDPAGVTHEMREPTLWITASVDVAATRGATPTTRPAEITSIELHGRGEPPLILTPMTRRPTQTGGLAAAFAMTDFKGLPGREIDAVIRSAAGSRTCRFARETVAAVR